MATETFRNIKVGTPTGNDEYVDVLVAREYDSTRTYARGAYCVQAGQTYRCINAILTPQVWTPANWTAVYLADEIESAVQSSESQEEEIESLQTGLSAETTAREEADEALSDDISDEATARAAADESLSDDIAAEAIAREAAIAAEAEAREAADSDLKTALLNAYPTDTASGSIANFPDGADDIPVKSLTVDIEPIQSGSGDPSPDNVRPISGHTQAVVTRTGKNLFDASAYPITTGRYISYATGKVTGDSSYACIEGFIPCKHLQGKTVTLNKSGGGYTPGIAFYTEDNVESYTSGVADGGATAGTAKTFTVPTTANYMRMTVALGETDIQIELGSTATSYEPYTATTINIDLDGTVYGGTLDVNSGVLTVDRALVDMGTLQWLYNTTYAFFASSSLIDRKVGVTNIASDLFKTEAGSWSGTPKTNALWGNGSNATIYVQYPITEVSEFLSLISGHQLCYELATPVTVQLTAEQLATLYGYNNIWADCGDIDVTYRADTGLYIDKLTGSVEEDMIADAPIPANTYFMVGNTLYLSTAAIAAGATLTPGTNCVQTTLAAALNALNS